MKRITDKKLIIGFLLITQIYFIIVVYSYHEALREDPASAGSGPPVPMVINLGRGKGRGGKGSGEGYIACSPPPPPFISKDPSRVNQTVERERERLVQILPSQFFAVVTTTQTSRYEQTAGIVGGEEEGGGGGELQRKKKRWMPMNLKFGTDSKITLWLVTLRFQHIRQQRQQPYLSRLQTLLHVIARFLRIKLHG